MTLDFRALQQPSMECILLDDANTVIHVCVPKQGAVRKLEALKNDFLAMRGKKADVNAEHKVYDAIAGLMSVNEEGLKISGKELKTKYRLTLMHLLAFEQAYLKFIDEIKSAKN